jgi:DNA-directed RNA polymerase subunit H (RpoH/RPB5)
MAGVLEHALVPMHEVLSHQEAIEVLAPFGLVQDGLIQTSSLPMIAIDDPALLGACVPRPSGVSADWPIDSIVRITRRSAFTGITFHYRCVSAVPVFPTMRMSANAIHEIILEDDVDDDIDEGIEEMVEEQLSPDELLEEANKFIRQEEDEQ